MTLKHGANKTVITQPLVLFPNMSTNPARVMVLCTNNAKPIINGLVVIRVIQTPVLQDKSSRRIPDAALMIPLTEPAARRPVVRVILL